MLDATGLMVFYENMLALNNVSIMCEDNQIVGVFGANSAGKSTLMYTLSGIMEDIKKKGRHGRWRADHGAWPDKIFGKGHHGTQTQPACETGDCPMP